RKMTDLQFNFISTNMESGIEQAKSLSKKTNINDALASSTEFANDYSEKMTGFIRQAVEIFTQSSDEATNLFEKTMSTKTATVKQPAKTTTVKGATKKPAKKAA
ncbi:MAG: TIGR01841 family phasin, partial [Gammaproteobacteria bacterium]